MKKPATGPGLILASKSPRRCYLLEQAGIEFSVIPSSFDENSVKLSSPDIYVRQLAESKAGDISEQYPDSWVIGADTIVLIDGTILGKPGSSTEARTMLKSLSGKTHQVLTGYCICCHRIGRLFSETVKTEVRFKKLTEKEIDWYINSGEPFDKAGAYGIQGIGMFLVRRINGSYTNVVGLPVCEIVEYLIKENVLRLTIDD
ncbi:MAG: septum formation inhibitor Maf [Proteobacteria bacterium]|nr:septum formation inhibitor Maf [Pseudomonadota bacterium]